MAIDTDSFQSGDDSPRIVAISLQQTGHLFNYLAGDLAMRRGDRVLVDSDGGVRVGTVELEPHEPAHTLDLSVLKPVIRLVDTRTCAPRRKTSGARRARGGCASSASTSAGWR